MSVGSGLELTTMLSIRGMGVINSPLSLMPNIKQIHTRLTISGNCIISTKKLLLTHAR